jgi:hypothetical protein
MKFSQSAKYALGVTAAVALLAGCSGGAGSQLAPAGGSQSNAIKTMHNGKISTSVLNPKVAVHAGAPRVHGHAIKPNCCAYAKSVFISDSGNNSVQTYSYPDGAYIGALPAPPEGFEEPQGMCSDRQGNVYIANTEEFTIDIYSHSGTFISSLSDPDGFPAGCAVNKKTGDVAVSNIINSSGGFPGNVIVYFGGTGTPTEYATGLAEDFFVGYVANSSTLWVSGLVEGSYTAGITAVNTATSAATPVVITGATVGFPGTVTYSGNTKTMVVGDQDSTNFYQVDPTTFAVTGTTTVSGAGDIVQATVKGPRLIGPDASDADADIFPYPAGGPATTTLTTGLTEPIGSAVSPDVPE